MTWTNAALGAVLLAVSLDPVPQSPYPDGLYAEVETVKGRIVLQLEFEKTPMTVANFVGLAEGTIAIPSQPAGVPFYDGSRFYRVVPGHVIQTGNHEATEATNTIGYEFPNEIRLPELNHGRAGMVNMANNGPHTNTCHWCILLGDRSYLDGDYTVFGHVVSGMDVVFAIAKDDEIRSIRIVRVGKAAEAFRPTTQSFLHMVAAAQQRVRQDEAKKQADEARMVASRWPAARAGADGVKYVVTRRGSGAVPAAGTTMKVRYSGTSLHDWTFVSTADGGQPYFGSEPEAFDFVSGKADIQVNRGFDAMVARMAPGETRTIIVPGAAAYGIPGYYGQQQPGRRRFHISPNTTLVYEVEVLK
jgi:cyclophilin family peptidyl-prolyl cis-trans isomerase